MVTLGQYFHLRDSLILSGNNGIDVERGDVLPVTDRGLRPAILHGLEQVT